jgi:isoleucyl-tRNA synthetase
MPPYPDVPASPRFAAMEEATLARWAQEHTFEASVEARPPGEAGSNEYVFYDGPPFANGLPHYGHLLTGFVKDAVPRYQTMRGRRVERRFGWDCHGLPAETEAEKQLGVSGRGPITEYGIARFNDFCRSSVLRYTEEWRSYVTRQARWVDFDNDYKTMDLSYMESVIWALKTLYDKGLLYEAYRVLPYCWECETPLSNFETRQDDAYRERQDPAVTVAFRLVDDPDADPAVAASTELWAWTTTPWTLPSNLAVAVGPDVDYAVFERPDGGRVVLGAATVEAYGEQLAGMERVATVAGQALVGRSFTPLFDFFADAPNAFVVLGADWVSTDEGTGVVQMAPGFGEDDQITCAEAGIAVICPVDDRTRFTEQVPDFAGLQVFEANQPVIRALRARGQLVRADSYVHSYPHCWRTDTPLVYKAVTSWFVDVTKIKERLLSANQEITWVPAHVRDGSFGKWLEGARDWSISRNRFWGTPIPVWKSDDPRYPRIDVYGSLDQLEADFGVRPTDLHRPAIDELTRPNPDDPTGRSTMRRVTDVLDCWFDSGSMPFAQVHYPFENEQWFEDHYPGDFVVEYIGQTRGWFYNLHVLAVALFDRPAFRTCLAHGIILGSDGAKMSKRLRNYPDPVAMFDAHGSDAMRWALLSSPVVRGGDTIFGEKAITDAVRAALLPLWNAWYFFSLYANAEGYSAVRGRTDVPGTLDRYVLAKLRQCVEAVTEAMEAYDIPTACGAVGSFLDALTNWYIRRSRDRFWGTSDDDAPGGSAGDGLSGDSVDAFDTLATVLEVLSRTAAPLLPLEAEEVWCGVVGAGTDAGAGRGPVSVHLQDWPDAADLPADPGLVDRMDLVRDICSAGHSIRKAAGRRARLPLASLTVVSPGATDLEDLAGIVADEVNVKEVRFSTDVDRFATRSLTVVFKVAAPRLGPQTQQVAAAAKKGDWETLPDGRARVGPATLEPGEFDLRLDPATEATTRALPGGAGLVVLDLETDEVLEAEGLARDLIREVQRLRRDAGLAVTDRISLAVSGDDTVLTAVRRFEDVIASQTLSRELTFEPAPGGVSGGGAGAGGAESGPPSHTGPDGAEGATAGGGAARAESTLADGSVVRISLQRI